MLYLYIAVTAVAAYLLGCFNGAIIISKHYYKKDIRNYGSGNAGLTNFYRTFGGLPTLLVLVIDLAKGMLAAAIGRLLVGLLINPDIGAAIGMLGAVLGHCFPVFYGFHGGKGILCTAGTLIVLDPRIFGVLIALFVIVLALTRYVSLGSILCAIGVPVCAYLFCEHDLVVTALALVAGALMVYMHRANIVRLVTHSESRFSFKRK